MTRKSVRTARLTLLATFVACGLFTIIASNPGGGGGGGQTTPTVGSIAVNTGFGAVSSTPYQCTGQGTIAITPQSLTGTAGNSQSESKPFAYSGFSSTTPNEPACQQTVIFTNSRPGTWQVTNGSGTCNATVVAGQSVNVKIWNGACR